MRKAWLVAAIALAAGVALASPDGDAILAFGLDGHWAVICARAASGENPHQVIAVAEDGRVSRKLDFGNHKVDAELRDAQRIAPDRLTITFVTEGSPARVVLEMKDKRFRSLTSVSDGKTLISDGRFTSSGLEVPWFEKCGGPSAGRTGLPPRRKA